jgi:hypothetical protein
MGCGYCHEKTDGLLDKVLAAMRNRGRIGVEACDQCLERCHVNGGPTKFWTVQGIRLAMIADRRNRHRSEDNGRNRDIEGE